jgi:hypothetical protein
MCKTVVIVATIILCLGSGRAFSQAEPMSSSPPGTPITPAQIGNWVFSAGISQDEAAEDAQARGYSPARGLHEDRYGDWIGQSGQGAFIVFPDGHAYPF